MSAGDNPLCPLCGVQVIRSTAINRHFWLQCGFVSQALALAAFVSAMCLKVITLINSPNDL
ncbi:hypothetical protein H4V95_002566 [Arthrobacter sp. CAN_C5]|nr:hypothetical protein [Arthrobacter sp. CAN_C5]